MSLLSLPESIAQWLASKSNRSRAFTLSQRNIYIFPTKQGFGFLAILLIMLVTAINYQNSLIYLFLFFLGAIFFISIWMCFLNLSGLHISSYEKSECFSGDELPFHVRLFSENNAAIGVSLGARKEALSTVTIQAGCTVDQTIRGIPLRRGLHVLERLRLESTFPFGMIIAWTWLKLDAQAVVYPEPLQKEKTIDANNVKSKEHSLQLSDELTDLKHYQKGDASNRIVWKHYAAKDQLLVRCFESGGTDSSWIKWSDYPAADTESKLSFLCFDVLNLSQQNQSFGLDIPGIIIQPAIGEAHRIDCLTALATFGQTEKSGA